MAMNISSLPHLSIIELYRTHKLGCDVLQGNIESVSILCMFLSELGQTIFMFDVQANHKKYFVHKSLLNI